MSGDYPLDELGRLEENLRRLAEVPSQAARDASSDIADAIQAQFDTGTDPYGRPWAPLAASTIAAGRVNPALTDTEKMRDSIDVRPMSGAGIAITIGDDKAAFHQSGTSRMPARKILPEGAMPDTWERALVDAAEAAFERTMKG